MKFLDHLEILRRKLLAVFFGFFLISLFFFVFGEKLLSFLTIPVSHIPVSLIYIRPQEKITAYLNASLFAGFIFSFPLLVIQSASFIYPALKKEEKLFFLFASAFILILFYTGSAFAYLILLPFACSFFFSFSAGDGISPFWSIGSYVELATSLILVISCIFQAPLPLLFMIRTGLIEISVLKKYRKHTVIIIFIISAFLTPPDIYTQSAVGILLYLLFEITLAAGRFISRKRS